MCTRIHTCVVEPDVAATARISKLKMGGGKVCCRVRRVARGLPENFTKFMRCPIASSIFPAERVWSSMSRLRRFCVERWPRNLSSHPRQLQVFFKHSLYLSCFTLIFHAYTFHHLLVGSCHFSYEEFFPHSGVTEVNHL